MENKICCCEEGRDAEDFGKVVEFLKVIGEPNRFRMLCCLKEGEQCVCAIWEALDLPQNLTSHHLKILKNFGLLETRKEGRKMIYRTNKEKVEEYTKLLNNFLISNL